MIIRVIIICKIDQYFLSMFKYSQLQSINSTKENKYNFLLHIFDWVKGACD